MVFTYPGPRRPGAFFARGHWPRAKGGTPGEGPPFDPLLRFFGDGVFRALRRAARAPPLDPARFFVKKRGKKLLIGAPHTTMRTAARAFSMVTSECTPPGSPSRVKGTGSGKVKRTRRAFVMLSISPL